MDDDVRKSWENFLNPEVLRPNLIMASLYIAACEMLKDTIIERIRDFYTTGFDSRGEKNGGRRISPDYETKVLSRNRSPIYAALDWLKESKAIDDHDIAAFERVKSSRNDLAHQIVNMLSYGLPADLHVRFTEMVSLIDKIERWWIVNVEIATNPDLYDQDIDESEIVSGRIMGLRALVDIALGSEQDSKFYIEQFLKHRQKNEPIN